MSPIQFRALRRASDIPGRLVSSRVGITRSRLSEIENGHIRPSHEEMEMLEKALVELQEARSQLTELAARVGWPTERL